MWLYRIVNARTYASESNGKREEKKPGTIRRKGGGRKYTLSLSINTLFMAKQKKIHVAVHYLHAYLRAILASFARLGYSNLFFFQTLDARSVAQSIFLRHGYMSRQGENEQWARQALRNFSCYTEQWFGLSFYHHFLLFVLCYWLWGRDLPFLFLTHTHAHPGGARCPMHGNVHQLRKRTCFLSNPKTP